MGALIGFERARQLRKHYGLSPVHLFVSSYRAPQIPQPDPRTHQLPEAEFVEEVRHRYDGRPDAVLQNAELMQLMLPALQADTVICETYAYAEEHPLDCPISAFGGPEDGRMSHEDLAAWRDQTYSSFTLRMFPGNHFFLQSTPGPLLRVVFQELTRLLSQVPEGQGA